MAKIYKLNPSLHEAIWGGKKLFSYGKGEQTELGNIAESWELSFVEGNEAKIGDTPISERFPKDTLGRALDKFERFPVLTKFIDAKDNLSVQVHPSDEYALLHENQYGKTEMWYVVEAEEGAGLYLGFDGEYGKDAIKKAVIDGTIENMLSFIEVKAGDSFFIPAGTVHAIGKGVLIYEIQQSSTLTYRLYDYKRKDKFGNERELHIDKALKVLSPCPYEPYTFVSDSAPTGRVIGSCEYFTVREYDLTEEGVANEALLTVTPESFLSLTAVAGSGSVSYNDGGTQKHQSISVGDTLLIPPTANPEAITASGKMRMISVEVQP